MKKIKRKTVYLMISIAISILLLCFAFLGCNFNLRRFLTSLVDFAKSLAYYFCEFYAVLFEVDNPITPSIIQLPSEKVDVLFPETFQKFTNTMARFWNNLFDGKNFELWLESFGDFLTDFSIHLMFLLPVILLAFLLFKMAFSGKNNDYDVMSKQLKKWLQFEDKCIKPCVKFVKEYVDYYKSHFWVVAWRITFLICINFFTIFIEFFAYLFYFAVSIDIISLYTQVYKLVVDLFLMFSSLPTIVWVFIAWRILLAIRKNTAFERLHHMEMRNKGFANSLGVCTMFTGNMGVGKTKLMTDVSLSLSTVYKHNAKDIILKIERWFPHFPWATYQRNLRGCVYSHKIFSLTSCEDYVKLKRHRFGLTQSSCSLCGYDFERYGLYYDNELENIYLLDILEEYTKAFFVYYLSKSYILGNYGVREDGVLIDNGNLPLWDYNFFNRSPKDEKKLSYYANILDFDVLRKGKILKNDNPLADTFEFGIVSITELDKERGNMLDNQELKKMSNETNRKNDLFNYSPKMGRHPATILYQPFINFLFDQQRPTKTEADLREVCDKVINIDYVEKQKFAMPFFFVEEILYSIISSIYNNVYENYRFNRADNSLAMYFFKNTLGRFVNWYEKMYNLYGYDKYTLVSDNGKLDGSRLKKDKYYLLFKKALSNRYSTDCYKEFFRQLSRMKNIGIIDYAEFAGVKATTDELRQMNSYFINDMDKLFSSTDSVEKK